MAHGLSSGSPKKSRIHSSIEGGKTTQGPKKMKKRIKRSHVAMKDDNAVQSYPWWHQVEVQGDSPPGVFTCLEIGDGDGPLEELLYPMSTADFLEKCWESKVFYSITQSRSQRIAGLLERYLACGLDATGSLSLKCLGHSLQGQYKVASGTKEGCPGPGSSFATSDGTAAANAWNSGNWVWSPVPSQFNEDCLPPLAAQLGLNWGAMCYEEDRFRLEAQLMWAGTSGTAWHLSPKHHFWIGLDDQLELLVGPLVDFPFASLYQDGGADTVNCFISHLLSPTACCDRGSQSKRCSLGKGDVLYLPPGTWYQFLSPTTRRAVVLEISLDPFTWGCLLLDRVTALLSHKSWWAQPLVGSADLHHRLHLQWDEVCTALQDNSFVGDPIPHNLVLPILQCLQWNYQLHVPRKLYTMDGVKRHPRDESHQPHPLHQDLTSIDLLRGMVAKVRSIPNSLQLVDLKLPTENGAMSVGPTARQGCDMLYRNGVLWLEGIVPAGLTEALLKQLHAKVKDTAANQYFTVQYFKNREDIAMDFRLPEAKELTLFVIQYLQPMLEEVVGSEARLVEYSCLISYPGAKAQPAHADCSNTTLQCCDTAHLYTIFITLEDVTPELGPLTVWPETHDFFQLLLDPYEHLERLPGEILGQFRHEEDEEIAREQQGEGSQHCDMMYSQVKMTVPRGSVIIMDGRTYHRGGANSSTKWRPVFYFTFASEQGTLPEGSTYSISDAMKEHGYRLKDFYPSQQHPQVKRAAAAASPTMQPLQSVLVHIPSSLATSGLSYLLSGSMSAGEFLEKHWHTVPLHVQNTNKEHWKTFQVDHLLNLNLDSLLEAQEDCNQYSNAAAYNLVVDCQQEIVDTLTPLLAKSGGRKAAKKVAAHGQVLEALKAEAARLRQAEDQNGMGSSSQMPILVHVGDSETNSANSFTTTDAHVARMCYNRGAGLYLRAPPPATSHLIPPLVDDLHLGFAARHSDGSYRTAMDILCAKAGFVENWHCSQFERFLLVLKGSAHCLISFPPSVFRAHRLYAHAYAQHCARSSDDVPFPSSAELADAAPCALQQGHMLYIPNGRWLRCCVTEDCWIVTVALAPMSHGEWLISSLRHVMLQDAKLRQTVLVPTVVPSDDHRTFFEAHFSKLTETLVPRLHCISPSMLLPSALRCQVQVINLMTQVEGKSSHRDATLELNPLAQLLPPDGLRLAAQLAFRPVSWLKELIKAMQSDGMEVWYAIFHSGLPSSQGPLSLGSINIHHAMHQPAPFYHKCLVIPSSWRPLFEMLRTAAKDVTILARDCHTLLPPDHFDHWGCIVCTLQELGFWNTQSSSFNH